MQRTAHKSAPVAKQRGVRGEQQDPAIDRKLRSRAAVPERCMASASLQELLWQSGQSQHQGPVPSDIALAAHWIQLLPLEGAESRGFKEEVHAVGHIQYL